MPHPHNRIRAPQPGSAANHTQQTRLTSTHLSVPSGTIFHQRPSRPTQLHNRPEHPNPRLQEERYETSVPTVADRVVQAALKMVLEPIFEADFLPVSYGFRPARRAHDAIAEIHLFGTAGYRWVFDADIEACLDALSHCSFR